MATIDPEDRIARLIAIGETTIAEQFAAALAVVRGTIDLDALAVLIEQARFEEAFAVVGRAAAKLGSAWSETYVLGGQHTAGFLNTEVGDIIISFDQTNHRAVRAMQQNQLRLIREFTEQQRRATNQALLRGMQKGINPRDQARAFRDSIGLTAKQEEWVANYRRNLNTLDRRALDRALRDRRMDGIITRAIESGKPLPAGKIDKLVDKYRQRMLKYRSEVIARTESLRSVHAGVREMYDQAIGSGQLDPRQIINIWNTAGDERVRSFETGAQTSHRTMHNQERMHGVPFTSGAGNQAFDPGTFGVAVDDIQCRCVRSTRILTPAEAGITVSIVDTF